MISKCQNQQIFKTFETSFKNAYFLINKLKLGLFIESFDFEIKYVNQSISTKNLITRNRFKLAQELKKMVMKNGGEFDMSMTNMKCP